MCQCEHLPSSLSPNCCLEIFTLFSQCTPSMFMPLTSCARRATCCLRSWSKLASCDRTLLCNEAVNNHKAFVGCRLTLQQHIIEHSVVCLFLCFLQIQLQKIGLSELLGDEFTKLFSQEGKLGFQSFDVIFFSTRMLALKSRHPNVAWSVRRTFWRSCPHIPC